MVHIAVLFYHEKKRENSIYDLLENKEVCTAQSPIVLCRHLFSLRIKGNPTLELFQWFCQAVICMWLYHSLALEILCTATAQLATHLILYRGEERKGLNER